MDQRAVAIAIPFFIVLIGIEIWVAWKRRLPVYRLSDTLTDLSCGIGQQALTVLIQGGLFWLYSFVSTRFGLVSFEVSDPISWIVSFLGVEIGYYWWHRLSHEVNLLWATHIVHHQSEDYNLAVALRQALFTGITQLPFYVPVALLGIPLPVFALTVAATTLYQFWIHTQLIDRLGPLEAVLNTPSHHRVHHAINPQYLDKNYGATLIIWDRLFGTFRPQKEPPVYGITEPFRSFNPIWANLHYFRDLWRLCRSAQTVGEKVAVWFKPPAWRPAGIPIKPLADVTLDSFQKYESPPIHTGLWAYLMAQLGVLTTATFGLLLAQNELNGYQQIALVTVMLWTTGTVSGLQEKKRWALRAEWLRLVAITGFAAAWLPGMGVILTTALCLMQAGWVTWAASRKVIAQ
ncbi:MAG: sterol desaturase family protein [Myxococcales bacterium]|nr:sterol desaturase family protein [Myxococcales bacterium]